MNLHNLRQDLKKVLKDRKLTQLEFARRHGLSYSQINKFLNGQAENPRFSTINGLEKAIQADVQAS